MIITAPNSLIPLAHIIISPESIGRHAKGNVMLKNVRNGEAPRFIAAFSSFTGTALKPSIADVIRNGTLTNAIASIIPADVPTNPKPSFSAKLPTTVFLEMTVSSAMPAAE